MIEPSMNPAPQGLAALAGDEPAIEIEIENPDDVTVGIDGVEIDLMPGSDTEAVPDHDANLAEFLDEGVLNTLATDVIGDVEADINSRREWVEMFVRGLDVLGMKIEERTEPWDGACGVYSSLLIEAAVRFQSETIIETFPAQGPVKTQIVGAIDKLKEEAAARVREDMNYQLVTGMPEYRPEHERLLFNLGLAGCAFKKVYNDDILGRQTAVFVPAEDIIIPYGSAGARNAPRVTHMMRVTKNDLKKLQVAGLYVDADLGEPQLIHTDVEKKKSEMQGYTLTDDERYMLYEVQVDLDVPGYEDPDGVMLPYIMTIDKGSGKVLGLYRNWRKDDELKLKKHHFVQYDYVPGFGAYGFGLIHLIGGYAKAGTSIIRQLVDAGTLSNLPGGMKTRGLRVKGDDSPIRPGEFRDVDVPSGALRDNIMPLPYKEPSTVLFSLLQSLNDEGRRLGAIADLKISDMSASAPVGTTLALLERQLKTMSAVQARVHFSMKDEFALLKQLVAEGAPTDYEFDPETSNRKARQADYATTEVLPVSDPNSSTMAQRIMQYQAAHQLSATAPQIYDLPELHKQMLEVLGIKNVGKIIPAAGDVAPKDPLSENMGFITAKPTKAFIFQDHDAHMAAHQAFMQDPMIAQTMGQNPMAQQMMGSIMAHIAEHMAFKYRAMIEKTLGVALPPPDEQLAPETEAQLSRLVAQASQQVLQQNVAAAQQAQAQQQLQDPLIQMQIAEQQRKDKETAIKEADQARKAAKDQVDAALERQKLLLKQREVVGKEELAEQKNVIDAQRAGVMGRSADAAVLREDREAALRLLELINQQNATNQTGVSGGTPDGGM